MAVVRGLAALCVLLLCGGARGDGAGHVIHDPSHNNHHLKKCDDQSDCSYERYCVFDSNYNDEHQKVCLHKTLFPNFSLRDGLAMGAIFFGTMLAASAGIGGGGLNTPIFVLICGFLIQEATPLSHVTIFGNSLAQFVINYPLRHPFVKEPGRPLIDYTVPLILLPPQLGGNNLGVLLNPIIPADILIILAEILLAYATFRVLQKGIAMYKAEAEARLMTADNASGRSETTEHSDAVAGMYREREEVYLNRVPGDVEYDAEKAVEIRERESDVPLKYVAIMVMFWTLFAAGYVGLKETSKCDAGYWAVLISMYPVLVFFLWYGSKMVSRDREDRESAGLVPAEGDIYWTPKKLIVGPIAACGVGIVAGLLGLGGGELMAPLLLELGMLPKMASATSAYMIIWTTSSDMVHYAIGGDLPAGYSSVFCALGFVGGLLGRFLAIKFVAKYNRQSLIALALAAVLMLSMILFAYRAATADPSNPWWPPQSPCN